MKQEVADTTTIRSGSPLDQPQALSRDGMVSDELPNSAYKLSQLVGENKPVASFRNSHQCKSSRPSTNG